MITLENRQADREKSTFGLARGQPVPDNHQMRGSSSGSFRAFGYTMFPKAKRKGLDPFLLVKGSSLRFRPDGCSRFSKDSA